MKAYKIYIKGQLLDIINEPTTKNTSKQITLPINYDFSRKDLNMILSL